MLVACDIVLIDVYWPFTMYEEGEVLVDMISLCDADRFWIWMKVDGVSEGLSRKRDFLALFSELTSL